MALGSDTSNSPGKRMAGFHRYGVALLGLGCLAGCSSAAPRAEAPGTPGASDAGGHASAGDLLRRAEAEHWLLKLTTDEGDTIVGRITVRGGEVRVSGTSERLDVAMLQAIHRGIELETPGGRDFGLTGGVIGAAVVAPLVTVMMAFGLSPLVGATLVASGAMIGAAIGSGLTEIDQPDPPVEWRVVWADQAETP